MENFSKRTTAILFVCFILFGLAQGYVWQKVAEESSPAMRCDVQFHNVTCVPVGKAAD